MKIVLINRKKQEGATLLVGLIMLILLTLMAISSFNLGKGNLQIVSNMQFRNETVRTAEKAVEIAISTPTGVSLATTTSTAGFNVSVTPTLVQAHVKKNSVIDIYDPAQQGCTLGAAQTFGVDGAATGNSLCAATLYNLRVSAVDTKTNASVVIDQGVSVQVPADKVCSLVPC